MMDKCRDVPRVLNGRNVITFSDMIWLPHTHGWKPDQFDRVFIDEAQDLSPARTELLINSLAPGGRICAVGDPKQALYQFAGAMENAIDVLIERLQANCFPLSVSYRCARKIIELAKEINPLVEARENAPDGKIEDLEIDQLYDIKIPPGSAVISRTNYPLIRACFGFLSRGINANINGRDIGNRFLWRIDCWNPDSTEALVNSIHAWRDEVCQRLIEKKRDTSRIEDEAKSIEIFAEKTKTVSEVRENISKFFSDEPAQLKLSTAHKIKGLEFDNVYVFENTFHPERGRQETNCFYVAITRAKTYLGILKGKLP